MVEDVELWRRAGRIGLSTLSLGTALVRPGASILDIAEEMERNIRKEGAEPAFPVNISLNDEAAHYTPCPEDARRIATGDVVKLDLGAHLDGRISDTATTIEVGTTQHSALLLSVREALQAAGEALKGGVETFELSRAIERAIHARGLKPVENLTGHTITRYLLHAGKSIPNTTTHGSVRLDIGEVVAVEPFATHGVGSIRDGPFGNILRFPREPEGAFANLFQKFKTLPFCLRWVEDRDLRGLLLQKKRELQAYPVFVEKGKGLVAQAEKTFLLTEGGAEVPT